VTPFAAGGEPSVENIQLRCRAHNQYVTEDLMHGLCLERNFYAESGAYISDGLLQLSTWGAFAE
jgi:hypothetical protein